MPDAIRALAKESAICVRNPYSTRPWQHVLEPLGGYLRLAEVLSFSSEYASRLTLGRNLDSNRSVKNLVEEILIYWPGQWEDASDASKLHEAGLESGNRSCLSIPWLAARLGLFAYSQ